MIQLWFLVKEGQRCRENHLAQRLSLPRLRFWGNHPANHNHPPPGLRLEAHQFQKGAPQHHLPQTHTPSTGYGQFFSKLMAKFSSPDSMADREWARAEREAARKERERAARRKRQAVLLQRVRALEAERDAYHSGGVEFPHEELLAQARANAVAAGAYGPWDGHSGDRSLVGADDALPPYTPATRVQSDGFCGDSQRGQPSQFHDTRPHSGVVQAHTADTRADRRAARQLGASVSGGALGGALVGMFLS